MPAKKKPPVTSSRTRQERVKNRGKAPASTPKPRQTAVGNRGAQAGPLKPGTRTSGTPMVNSSSPAMRQIQAKATELRNQVNRGVRAVRQPATVLPNSVRAGRNLIREGANRLRNLADSGQVRAAAQRGQQAVEAAKRNRARLAAGVGRGAKEVAALKGGLSALRSGAGAAGGIDMLLQGSQMLRGAMERAGFKPPAGSRSQAEIAQRRNPPPKPAMPRTVGPAMPKRLEQQGLRAQERRARKALDARKKATGSKEATPNTAASFDDAFRDARRAKVKTFTWRGKKYTTEMK
jgi:hypothetical protein